MLLEEKISIISTDVKVSMSKLQWLSTLNFEWITEFVYLSFLSYGCTLYQVVFDFYI